MGQELEPPRSAGSGLAVIGGNIHENPFFVPPEELLVDLRQRQNRGASGLAAAPVT